MPAGEVSRAMSDPTPTDDVYDYDHDPGFGCTDCLEAPPSRLAIIVPGLIAVLLPTLMWVFGGPHVLGDGWGFMLGVGAIGGAVLLPGVWTGILAFIVVMLSVQLWGTDRFGDAFSTGALSLLTVAAAAFVVASIGTWREYGYGLSWRGRDRITAEVKDGLQEIDGYLDYSAKHMSKHTISLMDDEPRKMLGLSGYAGSGKDTAAAELIYNNDYTRVSFADKLRAFALAVNPLIPIWPAEYDAEEQEMCHPLEYVRLRYFLNAMCDGDWTVAKRNIEVRALLQRIGTDAGRKVLHENVWVDAVMGDLPDGPLVFTDTRFPNEAQAIRDAGGYLVRVSRPGVDAVNAHESETALDGWDFDAALINESTLAAAREQMRNIEEVLYDPS